MSNDKTLIIPDIHLRHEKAEKIISIVKPDKIVFIGDYFDDFNDTPAMVAETADWLHHSVNQENRIHLVGNHDIMYWFKNNSSLHCAGHEQYKSVTINDFVTSKDWEKLVFYYNLDNKWLLTHAGLHPYWINPSNFKRKEIMSYTLKQACSKLAIESIKAKKSFQKNEMHWFAMPGYSRCSNSYCYGGLLWCDWDEEFHPVGGLHQIVGHTPNHELFWLYLKEGDTNFQSAPWNKVCPELSNKSSYNICLDSQPGSRYYAIYEDGQLSIHNNE